MQATRLGLPYKVRLRNDQMQWLRDRAKATDHKQSSIVLRRIIDQAMNRTKR